MMKNRVTLYSKNFFCYSVSKEVFEAKCNQEALP